MVALNDIQNSINDAIASVNLSETGLDAAAQAELQSCLTSVLENGGLPAGYSCISQSGSTSAGLKSTFNNVLEQFLGILPAKVIDDLQVSKSRKETISNAKKEKSVLSRVQFPQGCRHADVDWPFAERVNLAKQYQFSHQFGRFVSFG